MRRLTIHSLILLLALYAPPALPSVLRSVSLDSQGQADRIVIELDCAGQSHELAVSKDELEIRIRDAVVSSVFTPPAVSPDLLVVKSIVIFQESPDVVVIRARLSRAVEPSQHTLSAEPWRHVIDLTPIATDRGTNTPKWVPGDRPIRTKYAAVPPQDNVKVSLSRTSLLLLITISIAAGVAATVAVLAILHSFKSKLMHATVHDEQHVTASSALEHELSEDLDRLSRIADGEHSTATGALAPPEDRIRLVLKMVREGREIAAICAALELTPAQVKEILERHS